MAQRIVVDPITRIEGHLRIEVIVDDNKKVTEAYSSSTLFRGIETILKGRDPRDAGLMAQRICGVCTYTHYKAGVIAVENALGIKPPLNASLARTLMTNAIFLHDHIVHFYQLHGLDFIDVVDALKADPAKAAEEALKWCKTPLKCGEGELRAVQERIKKFVAKGDLGPFANGYYGNPTYHLTPEQNLIGLSHYLECLDVQRVAAQLLALFGAKQPHPQSLTVGGVTCIMDLQNPATLGEYISKLNHIKNFIDNAYYPDVLMIGTMYKDEPSVINDIGVNNYYAYEDFPIGENEFLFGGGLVFNGDFSKIEKVNDDLITEDATHSWYSYKTPLQPYNGQQNPEYTGFKEEKTLNGKGEMVETKVLDIKGKYSWIKEPRYNGIPMQVGPLSNILINYAQKNKYVVPVVDKFLKDSGFTLEFMHSTLGRVIARMLEAKIVADNGDIALNKIIENFKAGDTSTCADYVIDNSKEYKGRYMGEAPRGALSHWCKIKNGVIENWQAVVPSTWNASPKDHKGQMAAYEACLIGLEIHDLTQPLEIIRKIHSFDPCIACAVHVMDTKGNKISEYKINPNL